MRIVNFMTPDPIRVSPRDTLKQVEILMKRGGFRRVPVIEHDRIVGILTERDLRAHQTSMEVTRVDAVMRAPVIMLDVGSSVEEAVRTMLRDKIGGLPIVERGRLVGILTYSDVLRAFLNVLEATEKIVGP